MFPGARVLESGVGSGALTIALLRAVGPTGPRHRLRDPRRLRRRARSATSRASSAPTCPLDVEVRDVYEGIDARRPRPRRARPARAVAGREARRAGAAPGRDPARVPADDRPGRRGCARSSPARRSAWSRRSRCCSAPGTSTASRCAPTTAWWRTPASSPTPGCSRRRLTRRELPRPRRRRGRRGRRLDRVPAGLRAARHVVGRASRSGSCVGVAVRRRRRRRAQRLAAADPAARVAGVRDRRRRGRQAVGAAIGGSLLGAPRARRPAHSDRATGSPARALGVVGVLVLMWLLIPALANSPGWTARAVRDSAVARVIDRVAPDTAVGVGDARPPRRRPDRSPRCSTRSRRPTPARRPPTASPPRPRDACHQLDACWSKGQACDRIQEGTGFVGGDRTSSSPTRTWSRGSSDTRVDHQRRPPPRRQRRRVRSQPRPRGAARPGLALPALALGEGHVDDRGALFGHPGGGAAARSRRCASPSRSSPAAPTSPAPHPTEREVFVLAAVTAPGDSGAPVVDPSGNVVGVMFAYDISRQSTAYALTRTELDAVLGRVLADRRHRSPSPPATAWPNRRPRRQKTTRARCPGRSGGTVVLVGGERKLGVSRPR